MILGCRCDIRIFCSSKSSCCRFVICGGIIYKKKTKLLSIVLETQRVHFCKLVVSQIYDRKHFYD